MRMSYWLTAYLLFSVTCSKASTDDERVRMWIAAALDGAPAVSDASAKSRLALRRTHTTSLASWKLLKECRDSGQSLNLDLASAEHYLFIRSFAAEKGERDIEELPSLYGAVKDHLGPAAQLLKTSSQPVSPPDPDVVRWGNLGVAAGIDDFVASTSKPARPKTGNLNQYKLALEGYYANYAEGAKNPSCRVKP